AGRGGGVFPCRGTRLADRLRTRSVSNALSACAAAGPTCPCNNPPAPTAPRQRRADWSPSDNPTGSAPAATSSGSDAPVVYIDPLTSPPVVVTPPYIQPPRGHDKPRGGDKPTGDKPGRDKPTGSSGDKPTAANGDGRGYGKDKTRRAKGRGLDARAARMNASSQKLGQTKSAGPMRGMTMNRMSMNRPIMMNRPMMMGRMGGFRGGMGGMMGRR